MEDNVQKCYCSECGKRQEWVEEDGIIYGDITHSFNDDYFCDRCWKNINEPVNYCTCSNGCNWCLDLESRSFI